MSLQEIANQNMKNFETKSYPGRGVVIGQASNGTIMQVYWIMGRSSNSRNRVFVQEGQNVMIKAHDESKLEDPSLIIYHPLKAVGGNHIITNGDQTDTIESELSKGGTFESALDTRQYEPDGPNFTPRISGVVCNENGPYAYQLAILKTLFNNSDYPVRHYYNYENFISGFGHCLTTYVDDGSPLPSFDGEPLLVPIKDSLQANLDLYWNAIDNEHLVSMAVKSIDEETGEVELLIKNKLG